MIRVKGRLTDATGDIALGKAMIEFVAKRSAGEVFAYAGARVVTDENGRYEFALKAGEYLVYAQVNQRSDVEPLGPCTVLPEMQGEHDIESLLRFSEPVLPETVQQSIALRDEVTAKHIEISGWHTTVNEKVQATQEDARQTASDREQTGLELQRVIDHREATEQMLEDGRLLTQMGAAHSSVVEQNLEQVSTLHKAVTGKALQVSEDARHITQLHAEVASFNDTAQASATTASSQADLAKDWAEKDVDSEVVTGAFSAKHWATQSATHAGAAKASRDDAAQSLSDTQTLKNDTQTLNSETKTFRDEALQARHEIGVLADYEKALWSLIQVSAEQAVRQLDVNERLIRLETQ
ncbi:hypothetical protein [Grimontia sp. NTOU-MAR1]|uniref:hypothetical protein n=1 Tax=Grimontia sp. NTOU-MAR1 TaxID=3111011 RepID=UPI002DBC9265|nr:hypothetical protein [Grimontia sp. NTOU-MAR1]WRV98861.1 hypothetical protein VP504_05410 [Grimontia sp. NTOU-MAR1]